MHPLTTPAIPSILLTLVRITSAVMFSLDSTKYPEVTDHHCLALYCSGLGFEQSPHGFHRDTTSNSSRNRRRAIGCDGVVNCGRSMSCDEIPYASTYDGGLGCFATSWTNDGRSMKDLYSVGTHRCVNDKNNSAHGSALKTFYSQNKISNFEEFTVGFLLSNGRVDPKSTWCVQLMDAIATNKNTSSICATATSQQSFAEVTKSSYTKSPRCPSRNYRRDGISSLDEVPSDGSSALPSHFADVKADMLHIATLDNGGQVLPIFGAYNVGDDVWIHDDTLENGTTSKIIGITSFKEHLRKLAKH